MAWAVKTLVVLLVSVDSVLSCRGAASFTPLMLLEFVRAFCSQDTGEKPRSVALFLSRRCTFSPGKTGVHALVTMSLNHYHLLILKWPKKTQKIRI